MFDRFSKMRNKEKSRCVRMRVRGRKDLNIASLCIWVIFMLCDCLTTEFQFYFRFESGLVNGIVQMRQHRITLKLSWLSFNVFSTIRWNRIGNRQMALARQVCRQFWNAATIIQLVSRNIRHWIKQLPIIPVEIVDMQNYTSSLILYKRLKYYRNDRIDKRNVIQASFISRNLIV